MQAVKHHHMITPEHPNPVIAGICAVVSLVSTVVAWVALHDLQVYTAIGASCLAGISAIFGTVHFYYSTKEKKLSIREKQLTIKKLNRTP